jgi:serine/threonine protein kinase
VSEEAKGLLKLMLNRSVNDRISALDALQHPWFAQSSRRPISGTNL